jgi:hypothetical protein
MDSGKVFILVITVLAIGILAYLEFKSRRARVAESDLDTKK